MKPKAFAKAITADSCFKKNPSTGRLLGLTPAAIAELSGGAAKEAHGISNLVNQIQSKGKGARPDQSETAPSRSRKKHRDDSGDASDGDNRDHPDQKMGDQEMMGGDDGLVAPDDETYNIYN